MWNIVGGGSHAVKRWPGGSVAGKEVPLLQRVISPSVRRLSLMAGLVALCVLVAACAPGAVPGVQAPTFQLQSGGSRILRFDPPGVLGDGGLVMQVTLRTSNPNPVGLRLSSLDGELFLGGVLATRISFLGGVDLPARGSSDLRLEATVPLARIPELLGVLGNAVAGAPLTYQVDAAVGVELLGVATRFPSLTLARGEVRQTDLLPAAPRVRFDAAASGVRELRLDRLTLGLAIEIENTGPLGYLLRAPDARLILGGREVATLSMGGTPVPAFGRASWVQEVHVSPVALGAALLGQVQALAAGGSVSLDVALSGRWQLDLGLLGQRSLDPGTLVSGQLR